MASDTTILNNSWRKGPGEMALVGQGQDFVSWLEAGHARADCFDSTGAIGDGDDAVFAAKEIFALRGFIVRQIQIRRRC